MNNRLIVVHLLSSFKAALRNNIRDRDIFIGNFSRDSSNKMFVLGAVHKLCRLKISDF